MENKTLEHWIGRGAYITKRLERYLHLRVVREFSSAGMDWNDYLRELHEHTSFSQKHVYSFCVLENGYAVGKNENPSAGLSFPVCAYSGWYATGEIKEGTKITTYVQDQLLQGHIENRLVGPFPSKKEQLYLVFDNTELPHFPYPLENWKGKINVVE